ncbi:MULTISPECIES: Zn-ribbon domain-containing OB-fold protein [unclassified Paraburkholderia]|uniref:Zn-ribbon domain-containing OB-fold protein n=1 Tax=unclassified Paraburkholderia TaxID=2615204 RepID=UPI002AB6D7E9|nr:MULTISPECIES: Zn-ribbon domain-containing OB-fold protein [unclassified Paraburkholderia]
MTAPKSAPAKPAPVPIPGTLPFWAGTQAGELRLQHCASCAKHVFYPRTHCPSCGAEALSWVSVSGRATLYSYVISHMAMPGWQGETPYVIAVVQLEEGPRMMSNLVGVPVDPRHLELDMPLEVVFEARGEMMLPMFRPAGGGKENVQ